MINLFCVRTSDKQYISQLFHFEVTMVTEQYRPTLFCGPTMVLNI